MKIPLPSVQPARAQSATLIDNAVSRDGALEAAILDQEPFVRMLCLERKRTERSGRRFVLMLLEAGSLLKAGNDSQALDRVLLAVTQATRETDIKGWYKSGHVIGVIFTEIDGAHGRAVANALLSRVISALGSTLSIEDINEIRLSFHVYPEDSGGNGNGNPSDPFLYPDLGPDMDRKKGSRILKRSMDIAGSLFALLFSAPLLLAAAVAIKLTSKGPVLFRQPRVGQYGRKFTFLKFRSMDVASDHTVHKEYMQSFIAGTNGSGQAAGGRPTVFKLTDDSRVTPVGNFLRRTSLDEFPQFLNVLKGEMSLVGPRPAIPYEVEYYDIWHKQRLLAVKPGITGLWQVGGRSRIKFSEMVRLDLQYARSWSPWLDVKILMRTPRAVILREGAY